MHIYFIGYDAREHLAAEVAAFSLQRRLGQNSRVYYLEHMELRRLGFFKREWVVTKNGQWFDQKDGKPFSTHFSHSRFLVPMLARQLEATSCMFVDCDWLFLEDPSGFMAHQANIQEVGVVKAPHRQSSVKDGSIKMDGMVQQNYNRKLWSAMFTMNPNSAVAKRFDVKTVNSYSGRDLHGFLGAGEGEFWDIDPDWHYIPSLDPIPSVQDWKPKGIHYSEFSPWLNPEYSEKYQYEFQAWIEERNEYLQWRASRPDTPLTRSLTDDLGRGS